MIGLPNIEAELRRMELDGADSFTISELDTTDFEGLDGLNIGECNMEMLNLDFRMSRLVG